jgi:hypothetical protein
MHSNQHTLTILLLISDMHKKPPYSISNRKATKYHPLTHVDGEVGNYVFGVGALVGRCVV